MNFSTNQVNQLFVAKADSTIEVVKVKTPDKAADKAAYIVIDDERTDLMPKGKVLSITTAVGQDAAQTLRRKGVLIAMDENALPTAGAPEPGTHYVLTLNYHGYGDEDTYQKNADFYCVKGQKAEDVLAGLATSLLKQVNVEPTPLYEIYATDGTPIVLTTTAKEFSATTAYVKDNIVVHDNAVYKFKAAHTAGAWSAADVDKVATLPAGITEDGFYIVEPKPYWRLGTFPETLMNIDVHTNVVTVDSVEYEKWLKNYKFEPVDIAAVKPIYNSHRIADLEYFCKGERGVSAGLHAPYDMQIPLDLKVNPDAATGYDIMVIHYAYQGDNQQSTLSEKDITIVIPNSATTLNAKLTTVKTALQNF